MRTSPDKLEKKVFISDNDIMKKKGLENLTQNISKANDIGQST